MACWRREPDDSAGNTCTGCRALARCGDFKRGLASAIPSNACSWSTAASLGSGQLPGHGNRGHSRSMCSVGGSGTSAATSAGHDKFGKLTRGSSSGTSCRANCTSERHGRSLASDGHQPSNLTIDARSIASIWPPVHTELPSHGGAMAGCSIASIRVATSSCWHMATCRGVT